MKRLTLLYLSLVLLVSSCGVSGLAFKQQHNITIVSPHKGARVRLPVAIRWKHHGLVVRPPGSANGVFFGVFVDRPPLRPGQGLEALVGDDCRTGAGCADLQYFADHDVYLTDSDSIVLESLKDVDTHEVSIIVINQKNRRVGETNYVVEFREVKP